MKQCIELHVNGETYEVFVAHQTTLVEVLREQIGLTGTKEACGTGECGSCTVLADGKPILSCLTLAIDGQNREITTIEGIATANRLSPVQQAFQDVGAVQCGFCTPGMVLTTHALLMEHPHPSPQKIVKALEGNLCRCTGYNKIVEAVMLAAECREER